MILDGIADKAEQMATMEKSKSTESLTQGPKSPGAKSGVSSPSGMEVLDELHEQTFDVENLEKAMRVLIEATSLAVGLSWEHAFHAALHTIVLSQSLFANHKVLANFSMASFSCLLMLA